MCPDLRYLISVVDLLATCAEVCHSSRDQKETNWLQIPTFRPVNRVISRSPFNLPNVVFSLSRSVYNFFLYSYIASLKNQFRVSAWFIRLTSVCTKNKIYMTLFATKSRMTCNSKFIKDNLKYITNNIYICQIKLTLERLI